MLPTDEPTESRTQAARPCWSEVLRALREARGVTREGWAARLGVSGKTVQRWERGERAPDPGAEAAILAYCRERDLFRRYEPRLLPRRRGRGENSAGRTRHSEGC